MPYSAPTRPHRRGANPRLRHALLLALGLCILTGLILSDASPVSTAEREGFREAHQSLSFMPETVRLRTP